MEQSKTTKNKHAWWKYVLGIFIALVVISSASGGNTNKNIGNEENSTSTEERTVQETKPIEVTPAELRLAYDENEVKAGKKYKDKTVSMTGTVSSIETDPLWDNPIVKLDSGKQFYEVSCYFPENASGVADLSKGQTATLEGRVEGVTILTVVVRDCKVR